MLDVVFVALMCISSIKAEVFIENIECIGKLNTEKMDSKIDIQDRSYHPLLFTNFHEFPDAIWLENNGETIKIHFSYSIAAHIPTISEGPLAGKTRYRLQYVYINWMDNLPKDLKDGDLFLTAELHVVFYSTEFNDYEKALDQNNAIAVMSFVFELPNIRNATEFKGLNAIANSFINVRQALTNTSLAKSQLFALNDLLPNKSLEFQYTYKGNMINRKCSPDVIWLDFEDKLAISVEEIIEYRELYSEFRVPYTQHELKYRPPTGVIYRNVATINVTKLILIMVCFLLNTFMRLIAN